MLAADPIFYGRLDGQIMRGILSRGETGQAMAAQGVTAEEN